MQHFRVVEWNFHAIVNNAYLVIPLKKVERFSAHRLETECLLVIQLFVEQLTIYADLPECLAGDR